MDKKLIIFRILLVIIPVTFLFFLFEFVLPQYIPSPRLVYQFHKDRPVTFDPRITQRFIKKGIDISFKPNSLGYKDYEHPIRPIKPTFRVLLQGASYVQALQVLPEEQTGRVMERLAESQGINLEVITMGMSAYGQNLQLKNYQSVGRQFKPNLVIATFTSSDFGANFNGMEYYYLKNGKLLSKNPLFPTISPFKNFLRSTLQQTETYFMLRYMASKAVQVFRSSFSNTEDLEKVALAKIPPPKDLNSETHEEYLDRIVAPKNQRELFISLVKEFENIVVKKNETPLVHVIMSSFISKDIEPDYLQFLNWVEKVFIENGGGRPAINFHKIFTDLYNEHGLRVHPENDGHWNALGHQQVARKLIDYIQTNFDMSPYKEDMKILD